MRKSQDTRNQTTKLDVQLHKADLRLLQFKTYDEYLDSLVRPTDLFYLESATMAREVARLGYLATGKTYDEAAFYPRRELVRKLLYPSNRIGLLASESTKPSNELQRELSLRERSNRLGSLSTVIFVSRSAGSAHVDFAHRLATEDWVPFFRGKRKLVPRKTDLSYYDTRTGESLLNESPNYRPFVDRRNTVVFQNLHDGKFLKFDPSKHDGCGVKKIQVEGYDLVVLFDYVPRGQLQLNR